LRLYQHNELQNCAWNCHGHDDQGGNELAPVKSTSQSNTLSIQDWVLGSFRDMMPYLSVSDSDSDTDTDERAELAH
jgi:hypothetical protein